MFDLAAELPRLLPKAIAWAELEEAAGLRNGSRLNATGVRLAQAVGVRRPELVRVFEARELPFPFDPELKLAATETGLLGPHMAGLTLGYAVFIRTGHGSARLLSHECRHVYQYESAGSIAAFLPVYLDQIVSFGYEHAPLEVDARAHERDVA
jgi:hypothetical protein